MNLNDYEAVWKRQELPVGANADIAALRETFETKRRKAAATLFARDLLEGLTGVFVSGVFAYVWWQVGREGWPLVFAIALVLGVSGFFVRERFRAHRIRLGAEASMLTKVEADIAELHHQRRLLLNLWSWYLMPLAAAIVVVSLTLGRVLMIKAPPVFFTTLRENPVALFWIVLYFAGVLPLCFWGAWAINRRAVRKQIDPRLAELEKLHADLLASSHNI